MPKYSELATPNLQVRAKQWLLVFLFVYELSLFLMFIFFQKEAFKYGIRKLTKKKMVKVLTDIYEKTHSGSSNSDETRNAPQNSQG